MKQMACEIIFKCNSINNKNIREGELKILRKNDSGLYFEFGENEMNKKKRYYKDLDSLNKDYEKVLKLKSESDKKEEVKKAEQEEEECEEEKPTKYTKKSLL
jgi:hypothetical protein